MRKICFGCFSPYAFDKPKLNALPEDYKCDHFKPEYWESLGYKRNWGDAAVMRPDFEVLRREEIQGDRKTVEFLILADSLRGQLTIRCSGDEAMYAGGSY